MSGECTQHSDIVAKLANIDANVINLKEDMGNVKKTLYEIRDWMIVQKAITTSIPISKNDPCPEISVTDRVVHVDLKKIDWSAIGRVVAYAAPWVLTVYVAIVGKK